MPKQNKSDVYRLMMTYGISTDLHEISEGSGFFVFEKNRTNYFYLLIANKYKLEYNFGF